MQTHYPDYDVMEAVETWDDHTREIVKKRLEPAHHLEQLSFDEEQRISAAAAALIDDDRREILDYITGCLDKVLAKRIGESERKAGTPPREILLHQGLKAMEATAQIEYGQGFATLNLIQRQTLLGRIERAEFPESGPWQDIPQKDFFAMLLSLVVESYYSHPAVWSEIGYGGPAYPRGYVRCESGRVDPWEAKMKSGPHPRKE